MNGNSSKIFWGILVLIHLAFLGWQLQSRQLKLVDSEEYLFEAENILSDGTFYCGDLNESIRMDNYTKRPPVYPLFLAGILGLFGNEIWVIFFQMLLSLGNIWISLRLLREMYGEIKHKWALLFLILFYPAQMIYANFIMSEILFQTTLISLVYFGIKAWKTHNLKALGMYSFILMLGMLVKPILYLFLIPHLAMGAFFLWKSKKWIAIIPILLPLFLVLGYMQWNAKRTGHFHFSSIQNLSLLQYTTYNLLINTYGPEEALQRADSILFASLDQPTYGEGQKLLQEECTKVIKENKGAFLLFHIKGMFNFFIDPGRFDMYTFFQLQSSESGQGFLSSFSQNGYMGVYNYLKSQPVVVIFLLLFIAGLNGLKLLSVINFAFCQKIGWLERLILLGMIAYIAGLTGSSGASRFAVPLFPLMLITIPYFVDRLLLWKTRFRN